MALIVFGGAFKGKGSQKYMNPLISTCFSSYHHPTAKNRERQTVLVLCPFTVSGSNGHMEVRIQSSFSVKPNQS